MGTDKTQLSIVALVGVVALQLLSGIRAQGVYSSSPSGTSTGSPTATGTYVPGVIRSFAGTGVAQFGGDDSPALGARLNYPTGLVMNGGGDVLIADTDNHRIRRVSAATGVITTIAGIGVAWYGGDGGPATSAGLHYPIGMALDGGGNLLIADFDNHRIRRVSAATGVITTIAGIGVAWSGGDGGPATSAGLYSPTGVSLDGNGSVLIVDSRNHRIRRVAAGTGIITTLAGTGASGFSGDGSSATSADLSFPFGMVMDNNGNLLIADRYNHRIRRVAAGTGVITTFAGTGVGGFGGDGGPATSANLNAPSVLVLDDSGSVLIADTSNHRIRRMAAGTGVITTLAGDGLGGFGGDGGPATSASLYAPHGLALDVSGNLLITDRQNHRVRVVSAAMQPSFSGTRSSTGSGTGTSTTSGTCSRTRTRTRSRTRSRSASITRSSSITRSRSASRKRKL